MLTEMVSMELSELKASLDTQNAAAVTLHGCGRYIRERLSGATCKPHDPPPRNVLWNVLCCISYNSCGHGDVMGEALNGIGTLGVLAVECTSLVSTPQSLIHSLPQHYSGPRTASATAVISERKNSNRCALCLSTDLLQISSS